MKFIGCVKSSLCVLAGLFCIAVILEGYWLDSTPVWAFHRGKSSNRSRVVGHGECPMEPLHIVVLVMTRPTSLKTRENIRETWMQAYNHTQVTVTVKFVIGILSIKDDLRKSLLKEHKQNGDLLLLGMSDTYTNLPAKVLMGMRWASDNLNFDYLMKTDDDMYLRIDLLSQTLRQMKCDEMLYWGRFLVRTPDKEGRNMEKNWHLCERYFPYAVGGGYVLSEKLVKFAMPSSESVRLYNNEDVTVGAMLAPFKTIKIYDSRFITHGSRCLNDFIILNLKKNQRPHDIQSRLSRSEGFCKASNMTAGTVNIHRILSYLSADTF